MGSSTLTGVPLPEGELTGLRLVQGAGVRLVLLRRRLGHRVQRSARPCEQDLAVRTPARPAQLVRPGVKGDRSWDDSRLEPMWR
ncbi:hypothetical protein OHS70_13420 [Streptomyces sp. NBC_00390]|uniref:hypothetical protein n=1 Tax=Streptomyces sp. NBC_00390 TaxID=2975736 RepID=UPI002E1A772F